MSKMVWDERMSKYIIQYNIFVCCDKRHAGVDPNTAHTHTHTYNVIVKRKMWWFFHICYQRQRRRCRCRHCQYLYLYFIYDVFVCAVCMRNAVAAVPLIMIWVACGWPKKKSIHIEFNANWKLYMHEVKCVWFGARNDMTAAETAVVALILFDAAHTHTHLMHVMHNIL